MTKTLPTHKADYHLYALSEKVITIQFGDSICKATSDKITQLNKLINEHPFIGLETTLIAYTTLSIFYDPIQLLSSNLKGVTCLEKLSNYIQAQYRAIQSTTNDNANIFEIPVCYHESFGLDLDEVAGHAKLSIEEVIAMHTEATYTVYMIGFLPGFAYMGGLNQQLATPRKQTPRLHVPAGSVGIGGEQTGIYPLTSPGGWQIIGRTPAMMFNLENEQPSLLQPGDKVVFKPIELEEFHDLAASSL
jgi:inhibitor of KinA